MALRPPELSAPWLLGLGRAGHTGACAKPMGMPHPSPELLLLCLSGTNGQRGQRRGWMAGMGPAVLKRLPTGWGHPRSVRRRGSRRKRSAWPGTWLKSGREHHFFKLILHSASCI